MNNRPSVLVAARPFDLSDAPFDAFVERHGRLLELLGDHFSVSLLGLRQPTDASSISSRWRELPYCEVVLGHRRSSRAQRLSDARNMGRDLDAEPSENAMIAAALAADPEVIVTIGPWLNESYRPLFALRPTVHMFEEDLSQMIELAPQSRQARGLRRVEIGLASRSLKQPVAVCYIARSEETAARRRYPRAKAIYLPYTLDPTRWPAETTPSGGSGAIVVGNMSQPRNAEGLAELCALVAHRPGHPLWGTRVLSDGGMHPCLEPFLSSGMLVPTNGQDAADGYRSAALAIVPAKRMSGLKTTVLQAWTMGCPVVGYSASANSVGATASSMRFGTTSSDVLDHIDQMFASAAVRRALVAGGFAALRNNYDDVRNEAAFLSVVRHAIRVGQATTSSPASTRS
jgi:hypothetical protein